MVLSKNSEKKEVWTDGTKHTDSLNIQRKQISSNAPGTQILNFTFIPTLGTLPSQVLVGKDHNYKLKVVSCRREEMSAKPEGASVKEKNKNATSGSIPDSYHTSSVEQNFTGHEVSAGQAQDIQQNDLFIAEFVLVMDSDEGEDEGMNKSNEALTFEEESYKISGAQLQEKPIASLSEVTVNEICIPEAKQNELSQDVNCEEKELELHSVVSSIGSFSYKPQLANSYSTNPRLNHKKPLIHCISESREFLFSSAPYSIYDEQTLTHSPTPNKLVSPTLSKLSTSPVNMQHTLIHGTDETIMKVSQFPNELEMQDTVVKDSSSTSCEMRHSPSPFQLNIIRYPLCASPSPLHSPFHGSSSTICSMGESGNPISPASSCEAISPVPSRLSFLTSVLRSKKTSDGRPHSLNLSQFNLTSRPTNSGSFLQKPVMPSTVTRKSVSCFSLDSPQESKRKDFHGQTDGSFHQRSIRTLSPDSEYYTSVLNSPRTQTPTIPPYFFKENIPPTNVKPPLNKPLKKYPLPAKYRKVASLPLNLSHSSPHLTSQKRATSPHLQSSISSFGYNRPTNYTPAKYSDAHSMHLSSNTELQNTSQLNTSGIQTSPNENKYIVPSISLSLQPNEKHQPNTFGLEELSREHEPITTSLDRNLSSTRSSLSRSSELLSLSQCSDHENKKLYRIKPNYKVFAAIPTNKLLLDQKALDEPEMSEETPRFDETTETRPEVYSPALLRQQTEEVCAVIDEVLHDPLPLHCDSSRPSKTRWDSKRFNQSSQMPKSSSGSAGRETKYASLQSRKNAVIDCQQTKPGVIKPLASKVTYMEKKDDDDCSSNPFSHCTSSRKELDDVRIKKRTHQNTDL
ncbi:muscular LMNA-interacting protein [Xenopus laevis]|uniref:Muscular LMNA-interacting protein n=2 Tax=Xenopus laevis TaxID=8355 RepID=A0A1L8G9L8_XENLA|nr:muscular LMNA-interacting protein [Xenopus laevis]OCT80540.1 hypothetical protein XELAEV_18027351mg [Xenopus laevis]